jgi:hypothetical protein
MKSGAISIVTIVIKMWINADCNESIDSLGRVSRRRKPRRWLCRVHWPTNKMRFLYIHLWHNKRPLKSGLLWKLSVWASTMSWRRTVDWRHVATLVLNLGTWWSPPMGSQCDVNISPVLSQCVFLFASQSLVTKCIVIARCSVQTVEIHLYMPGAGQCIHYTISDISR